MERTNNFMIALMQDELSARLDVAKWREQEVLEQRKTLLEIEQKAAEEVGEWERAEMRERFKQVIDFIHDPTGWVALEDFLAHQNSSLDKYKRGRPVIVHQKSEVQTVHEFEDGQLDSSIGEESEIRFKLVEDISMYPDIVVFLSDSHAYFSREHISKKSGQDPDFWGDEGRHGRVWNYEDWKPFVNLGAALRAFEAGELSHVHESESYLD